MPAGATCTLTGTRIDGDVTVGAGATLQARGMSVGGHLSAQGAAVVTVNSSSTVAGSILLRQGGSATLDQVQVNGNVRLEANQRALSTTRNQVRGSMQIVANQAGVIVRDNVVSGTLECSNNQLAPLGGANQAGGLAAQCAELNMRVYLPAITSRR